jgi:DNA-binding beta-propeller fold protein YncE
MSYPEAPAGRGAGLQEPSGIPSLRIAIATLAVVIAVGPGCRRKDTSGTSASPPGSTPVVEREEPPVIRSNAESGRPPFEALSEPRDGAVDRLGRVWIADFGHSRLKIFDKDGGYLGGWGGRGNGTYGLRDPCGIAIREDDVYVADTWNGRVQHFTLPGEWKGSATGFFGPRGVAVGPDGRVWITDTGNHKVVVFNRSLGEPRAFGKLGPGAGEFSSPVGIAVGPAGEVYVADTGNRRIEVLNNEGGFQKSLPVAAWEGPAEPFLEIGETGEIYVTNPNGNTVLELASGGTVRNTWSSDDSGTPFARPTGIALDGKQGILYVVNSASNGVSKIHLPGGKKP